MPAGRSHVARSVKEPSRGTGAWSSWDAPVRTVGGAPHGGTGLTHKAVRPVAQGSQDLGLRELCTRIRKVAARETVFYKGDMASHIFVVVSGRVKVSAPSDDGKEITFAILGPGELFGEMSLLEQTEHSSTVTALEPSELGVFSRQDFQRLLMSRPAFTMRLLGILCERLRKISEMAEDIFFLSLPARLAKKLLELMSAYGEKQAQGVRIRIHLCQQELANLIGTSRESVNKQLAAWHASGLVRQEDGHLVVMQPESLAALAGLTPFEAAPPRSGAAY